MKANIDIKHNQYKIDIKIIPSHSMNNNTAIGTNDITR